MFTDSRADQKAATRARILEAARSRLESIGFEATNIRDVARDAGVSPGTVILHFKDKQELLHTALFDDLERTWAAAKRRAKRRDLEGDLVGLAKAFFAYYAARPALSRALLRESLFASPPFSERFAAQVAEVHAHVASLAAEAVARGELDERVDPALLGATFFSFYYFALLAWLQGGHPEPTKLFHRLLAEHLRGAAPRPPTRRKR
jgi:AcrR family transcriptional regulator